MPDPPIYRDTATPRWVKVSGIVGLVLILLLVTAMLIGGGFGGHGPGRHSPGGDTPGGHTGPPPGVNHPQP